jgi:predicted RNA-binding protein with PIN domain
MPYLIDGYNVIGQGGRHGLSLKSEDKEQRLLDLLARWRDRKGVREGILVVFDGSWASLARGRTTYSHRGIAVEYAVGRSADDAITAKVARAARARDLTVVSADHAVQREAKRHGARVLESAEFLDQVFRVLAPAEGEKPQSPPAAEVDEWLRIFSDPDRKED